MDIPSVFTESPNGRPRIDSYDLRAGQRPLWVVKRPSARISGFLRLSARLRSEEDRRDFLKFWGQLN